MHSVLAEQVAEGECIQVFSYNFCLLFDKTSISYLFELAPDILDTGGVHKGELFVDHPV